MALPCREAGAVVGFFLLPIHELVMTATGELFPLIRTSIASRLDGRPSMQVRGPVKSFAER